MCYNMILQAMCYPNLQTFSLIHTYHSFIPSLVSFCPTNSVPLNPINMFLSNINLLFVTSTPTYQSLPQTILFLLLQPINTSSSTYTFPFPDRYILLPPPIHSFPTYTFTFPTYTLPFPKYSLLPYLYIPFPHLYIPFPPPIHYIPQLYISLHPHTHSHFPIYKFPFPHLYILLPFQYITLPH